MKILCITHADFETPGVIETWARERGHAFSISKPYQGDNCLTHTDFDFLIVMGGPQSACEWQKYSYLQDEIALIKQAVQNNKYVIGVCLGAQLISEALGSSTERSPEKEVGVFPVTLTPEGKQDTLFADFPAEFPVVHWHNDMPGIPAGAQLLAYSKGCPRQVIKYTDRVYGLQCHLEITRQGMATMVAACPDDLKPSLFTQTPQELLSQDYAVINGFMRLILDRLTDESARCDTTEMLAAWQPYITSIENWQRVVENITPRKTGCGVVYELPNPIERPNENFAIVDMSGMHFSEPHYHQETEVYFVLQGSGTVVVGGKEVVVQKGSAVIIPSNVAHFVIPEKDLVLAVVNNPPFQSESYRALTESSQAVHFNKEQFIRLAGL